MNVDYLKVEWEVCPECGSKNFYTYYKPTGTQLDVNDREPLGKRCRKCGYVEVRND